MELKEKLSGLIITFNEEKNIQEILADFSICDEIIVVDSFSSDQTIFLAQQNPKVKIIQHAFEDFTKQRNIALEAATNDWVLFLDGDERITPELRQEIISELNKAHKKEAYYFFRQFYFAGKSVNFSGTQNDKNFRLFRKSKCRYIGDKKVHETLEVKGETAILKNKLLHYSFDNYEQFKKKMIYYGLLKGSELAAKGKKYSLFTHWFKVAFKFLKTYFFKLGFLDGLIGLKISYLQSLYVNETYIKLKTYK